MANWDALSHAFNSTTAHTIPVAAIRTTARAKKAPAMVRIPFRWSWWNDIPKSMHVTMKMRPAMMKIWPARSQHGPSICEESSEQSSSTSSSLSTEYLQNFIFEWPFIFLIFNELVLYAWHSTPRRPDRQDIFLKEKNIDSHWGSMCDTFIHLACYPSLIYAINESFCRWWANDMYEVTLIHAHTWISNHMPSKYKMKLFIHSQALQLLNGDG